MPVGYPWARNYHQKFTVYSWVKNRMPAGYPWASHGLSMGHPWDDANGMSMGCRRGAHGLPLESYGLLMGYLRNAITCPWATKWATHAIIPLACLWDAHGSRMGYSWAAHGLPLGCPRATHGLAMPMGYPYDAREMLME